MECAYIDNILAGQMRTTDPKLQARMAHNAMKHIGTGATMVVKKVQLPHIRKMTLYWLWYARANLLHKNTQQDEVRLRKLAQLRQMKVTDSKFAETDSEEGINRTKSTAGYF